MLKIGQKPYFHANKRNLNFQSDICSRLRHMAPPIFHENAKFHENGQLCDTVSREPLDRFSTYTYRWKGIEEYFNIKFIPHRSETLFHTTNRNRSFKCEKLEEMYVLIFDFLPLKVS